MRNLISTLALTMVALVAISLFSTPLLGAETEPKLNMFDSREACGNALLSGNYTFYEAKYLDMNKVNPVDGKTRRAVPLEANACVHGKASDGKEHWLPKPKGFNLRWRTTETGTLIEVYAMDDCGNPADEIFVPTPVVASPPPPVVTEPAKKLDLPQNVYNSFYIDQSTEAPQQHMLQPLLPQPPKHGWCGIFRTNAGCNWATGVLVAGIATAVIVTQGNDERPGPVVHTDEPTSKARIAPKVGIVPPGFGRGSGGLYLGASIGW